MYIYIVHMCIYLYGVYIINVSQNDGTPKSSKSDHCSIKNHGFRDPPFKKPPY